MTTPGEIERMFDDATYAREAWLRDRGWDYSSAYPDCYWRWSKDVKGERLTTRQAAEAVEVQVALDGWAGSDEAE